MGVLHRRSIVAAGAVVAFNLLMFILAAMGSSPMEAPFLVAWITGDAVLSVAALFLTERPYPGTNGSPGTSRTLAHHCGTSPDGLGRAV
jgi:hypothetical protein